MHFNGHTNINSITKLRDLPKLKNGQGEFGLTNYKSEATDYLKLSNIRTDNDFTTQHISRPNNANDLEIYQIAVKKWINEKKRLNYAELPTRLIKHSNTSSFTNRFAISPVRPLSTPGSDSGGIVYRNSWDLDLPYDGFYAFKSTVDNAGRILIDGREVYKFKGFKNQSPKIES